MQKLISPFLRLLGGALLLVGLVGAYYGPLEIFVFYLFSEGGQFYYDGFGMGSLWFAYLVVQNLGYYIIAAICIPIGLGHIWLRRWALTLARLTLWFTLGSGEPLALGAIPERDWRAVVKWLKPLVTEWGVEVLVTDDLKEFAVATERLQLSHQVCHFHLLRWLWHALEKLRKQLDEEQHELLDEIWQIMKERPPDGRMRLFELWQAIEVRRVRDEPTSALYRLRLLILRLLETWPKYTLDQHRGDVPPTNNATERAIGKWRMRSHSTRSFKSWAGLEAAFLLCGSELF